MKANLLVFTLFGLVAGCSPAIDRSQIPGTYTAGSIEALEIRPNGSYRHVYAGSDGKSVAEEGQWEFAIVEDRPNVVLQNFHCTLPGSESSGQGYFLTRATANWRGVRLWVDDDRGLFYQKK